MSLPLPSLRSAGRLATLVLLLIAVATAAAEAQGGSQRPFRGLFGGGGARDPQAARTNVALLVSFNGTYDEHLAPGGEGGGPSSDPSTAPAGSIAEIEATLRVERVRQGTAFGLDVTGFVNRYGSEPVVTTSGSSLNAHASRSFGRADRMNVRANQSLSYDPVYTGDGLSLVRPVEFVGEIPVDPTGLYFRDSWTSDTSVGLTSQLTRQDRFVTSYGFTVRNYPDDVGGDSKYHNVSVAYDRLFSRSWSVQTNYQLAKADVDLNARFALPLWEHFITVGPQYVKRLSPTRRLMLGAGFGGTYVKLRDQLTGVESATWSPTGQANAAIDIGRSWMLAGNYARSVTILEGLTPEQLLLDTTALTLRGVPHDRLELSSSFGFSVQGSDLAGSTATSDFTSKHFGTQARIALTRMLALQLGYSYFDYDFGENANLIEGVPPRFSRNVGSVGLTVWLPLYGRTQGEARP